MRVAPREVELLEDWASRLPVVGRVWIVRADAWGSERRDARLDLAVQLLPIPAGVEIPDIDTSGWESQLDGLIPPEVSLTILDPGIDPDPYVRGGVEVFRRTLPPAQKA